MIRFFGVGLLIIALSGMTLGCGPAQLNYFTGNWTTNIGELSFTENGAHITGMIHGYGGVWNDTFQGTLNGNEATFNTKWFGDFTLVSSGDTFKAKSTELGFCGIRTDKTQELPTGCGFSGKWIIPAKGAFPDGSSMVLKQLGENVTGNIYDGNKQVYDTFTGTVYWGKGWMAKGTSAKRGDLSLASNAAQSGFQFLYGSAPNDQQLCAVRDGVASAYLSYFNCEP